MAAEFLCYSVLYWLFALVVIFPPDEAVSSGLTIETLLGSWLGSETMRFVQYHIRRTAATIIVHTLLIPGYVVMLAKTQPLLLAMVEKEIHPHAAALIFLISLLPAVVASVVAFCWQRHNWRNHPLAGDLKLYVPQENTSPNAWVTVASDVNNEFRRIDKFSTKANSVCRIIATDSWLVKITSYRVHILHQRDAVLSLESSIDNFNYSNPLDTQHLNIKVKSIKDGIPSFHIKLKSLEYNELERKIVNPVVNARRVMVQQSISDRFLVAFRETINFNPKVSVSGDRDMCFGCMEVAANVKLQRRCSGGSDENGRCETCYCRPMWCVSCLSEWFAARQDKNHPETWLSSRAPCPTCRSKFCMLDVCMIL